MVLTLLISIAALVLSIVSLSWQIWSWTRSGPVLQVSVTHSLPTYGPGGVGDWHTTVTAVNIGRSPVTVTSWGFETPDGGSIILTRPVNWSDPLPFRIESHASGSWHIPQDEIRSACQENGVRHQDIRAWVSSASGRVYARKRGIRII
jgi:hypothetical protein